MLQFAPIYHSPMKHAAPVRKEMGARTIFNILGPLANPAGANFQLLGVYDENLVEPLARVLANLGVKKAMVVHGHDGLDEISMTTSTTVCEVNNGSLNSFFLDPRQFGFEYCKPGDLAGGGPQENAGIAARLLGGEKGPKRDSVLLNSAVCLYMFYNNITLRECVRMAADVIDSGRAMEQLNRFVKLSNTDDQTEGR
jgi:anthranilate phosphoribosyltransferase